MSVLLCTTLFTEAFFMCFSETRMLQRFLGLWIFTLLLVTETVFADETVNIHIKQGDLKGKIAVTENGKQYLSFQGIPYAKAPVGALRFKDPEPADSWTGVRDATSEGSDCPQTNLFTGSVIGNDDCLFLNVYSPRNGSTSKAVMVWIHGGGFVSGSGSTALYGPQFLMEKDVVIVTINYRLGALGFLSTGDNVISGNRGLKDQVQALRWVRENIAAFRGDPNNVTIFGESAGGSAVHFLFISPLAAGLFNRAISMSGTALNSWAFNEVCRDRAFKLGEVLGSPSTNDSRTLLDFLQTKDTKDIVLKQTAVVSPQDGSFTLFAFLPCPEPRGTEDAFLTDAPARLLSQGKFNQVPFITGVNSNEGKMFIQVLGLTDEKKLSDLDAHFTEVIGRKLGIANDTERNIAANNVRRLYFGDKKISNQTLYNLSLLLTDMMFFVATDTVVRLTSSLSKAPVYLYQFSYEGHHLPLPLIGYHGDIPIPGVQHSDDVSYIFLGKFDPANFTKGHEDDKVRQSMLTLWTNFAKTGDPTPNNQPPNYRFTPFTINNPAFLDINAKLTIKKNLANDRLSFWRSLHR